MARSLGDTVHYARELQLNTHALLECGGGIDDRATAGFASLRGSCVAAQDFFEGRPLAVVDEPEDVSPLLRAEWNDVRRGEVKCAVTGWLDEGESGADGLVVVDTVVGVEVLTGHDFNPSSHVVEPPVDVPGELMIGREP